MLSCKHIVSRQQGRLRLSPLYVILFQRGRVVQTEQQTPDAWIGLLREPREPGQPLGPTHKAMMVEQFGRIFFGKSGLWWEKDLKRIVSKFGKQEVKKATMAQVIRDNTDADVHGNVFRL